MIGTTVDGKYEVLSLLGKGGMGAVYEVLHTGTNLRLALKVIDAGEAAKHKPLVVRLQREARAAGAIASPNILQVVDAGTDPSTDTPYLVMELLEGEDLQQALNRVGALRPDVALRIIAQAAIGLGKAHEASVVHRDIKPANIYLARQRDGELVVKILDFGIAKLKQDELSQLEGSLTRTGSVLGSPLYMSPEQARGTKSIDHRADLWSLGVVAYQLLTGRTPCHDIDALGELILAICSELPPCVQDFAPWVDLSVAATVHRALALDAAERFQTAGDMFDEICGQLDIDPATGKPDLRIDASMILGVDSSARSISRPRLIAETGRRPAHTRPMSIVVTPPPNDHYTGDRGRQPSAAEIAAGATLAIPALSASGSISGSGDRRAASASTSQDESRNALAALAAPPVPQGTAPGLSRSSPAAAVAPDKPRLPAFLAGAAAAVVVGAAVAVAMSGVLKPSATSASATPAAQTSPVTAPADVTAPDKVDEPPPAVVPTPLADSAAASSAPPSASAAPSSKVPEPRSGLLPTRPTAPPAAPPAAPPVAPSTVPKANNSGTNGFGDRK